MALRFSPTRGAASLVLNALVRGPQGTAATVSVGAVTAVAVHASNADGFDVSDWIASWDDSTNAAKGAFVLRKEASGAVLGIFAITSVADNTTWLQLNVAYVSGSGAL